MSHFHNTAGMKMRRERKVKERQIVVVWLSVAPVQHEGGSPGRHFKWKARIKFNLIHRLTGEGRREGDAAEDNGFTLHKSIEIEFHNPITKTEIHIPAHTHTHTHSPETSNNWIMYRSVLRIYAAKREDEVVQRPKGGRLSQLHSSWLCSKRNIFLFFSPRRKLLLHVFNTCEQNNWTKGNESVTNFSNVHLFFFFFTFLCEPVARSVNKGITFWWTHELITQLG